MCYAIGSDQGYYPRRYKGLVPSRFNILMKRRAPHPDGQWLERQGKPVARKNSQEILSWEIFCWEIFDTPGKVVPLKLVSPKIVPRNFVRQERSSPGSGRSGRTNGCQLPTPQTFVWLGAAPRTFVCMELRSWANVCSRGKELRGEHLLGLLELRGALRPIKKKKKKIFFPFNYITVLPGLSSIFKKILSKNFFKKG